MSDATTTSSSGELCTQCGLCCVGALHTAAALDPDEIADARALGLPVLDRAKPGFGLPCPMLAGTRCGVYERRPRVCARYRCRLLEEHEAGEVPLGDALRHVETAKTLFAQASAALPRGMTLRQARRIGRAPLEAGKPADDPEQAKALRLRLLTTALDVHLDRHFRTAREGRAFEATSLSKGL